MKKILLAILGVVIIVGLFVEFKIDVPSNFLSGQGGVNANDCQISSQTVVAIGDDISTQILAQNYRRAWARIQQPLNATNTAAIGFGQDASFGAGIVLPNATTSSEASYIEIGLNTDFPFIGSVEALTSTGSTTILVTDCVYY